MADLTPTPGWDVVPQLETSTPALGGPGAPMNSQAQALLNRTQELRDTHQLADYTALRAYVGDMPSVYVTGYLVSAAPSGIAGVFVRDDADTTSADNGGTIIVASNGKRWKRQYDGAVNAHWFDIKGDGTNEYSKILEAWNYCLNAIKDLYFPAGVFSAGINNMPFKHPTYPASDLIDCGNITIFGEGPATVLRTDSVNGADVLNVYSCKNLHFKNMMVKAAISGSVSGSNGVSVVGGFDNLTFDNIWCENLPSLDKTSYVDGGKAFTVQPGTPSTECGTIKARIFAKGCAEGFGYEVDLSTAAIKKTSINIEVFAEDCYVGTKVVGASATGALNPGMAMGLVVNAHTVNCQKDVILNRAHGVDVKAVIITTKTEAARRLSPGGVTWFAADTIVESLNCAYAKDSRIEVTGYKGSCAYKARIGGTTAGSSGLNGATQYSDIYLDIGGAASVADVQEISSGGNTISNCRLYASNVTCTSLPTAFYAEAILNDVAIGTAKRLCNATFSGTLQFAQASAGAVVTGAVDLGGPTGLVTYVQGKATSSANVPIAGFADNSGTIRLGIMNGNGLMIDAKTSSSAIGTYNGKLAVYDTSGGFIAWIALYN